MSKQVLYILTGRSFAGKTTLRKKLVRRFGFSVVSVDSYIEKYKMYVPQMTQKDWDLVYFKTYEKLKKLLREGKTTIHDGNLKRSERNLVRTIAKEFKIPHKLIHIKVSEEEVMERWKRNQKIKNGRKMDEKSFNIAQEKFEEPTDDEDPIIYTGEVNLDEWIKKNTLI